MSDAERTALYRILGDADLLLYIGVSNDFGQRWKAHAKAQPWWDEMRRLSVDAWYDSRREAEAVEKAAIKTEGPKCNKVHAKPAKHPKIRSHLPELRAREARLGAKIRELREARGLTQADLAAAMTSDDLRWYQSTVHKIERGERMVDAVDLLFLAEIFEMSMEALLQLADGDSPATRSAA
jgi:ribosome-binding protein aMBF1 (putative translation factor)